MITKIKFIYTHTTVKLGVKNKENYKSFGGKIIIFILHQTRRKKVSYSCLKVAKYQKFFDISSVNIISSIDSFYGSYSRRIFTSKV